MSQWYPVMLNLEGRVCVVFGGGAVAERKTQGLLDAGADVRVVSPTLTRVMKQWVSEGRVRWIEREAEDSDVFGATLLFAATDNRAVNRRLAETARELGVPANIADDGECGDFIVPAVLRRGDLVLTASASGTGPALSARIISELAVKYGPEYNESTQALKAIRAIVKAEVGNSEERRELLRAAVSDDALEEWRYSPWLRQDKAQLIERLRQRAHDRKG
ncbi:bifunctional precorrin-2 dehydrogenase/sirohydrochlorin ferrochelatase [Cohnella endophytica]|uniref:precorrin-2 dehydrogenase n=1 Tax=Cohnella endophytica TaxID=2419778 RepID=A0A494XUI9_9BACL|nr:bifunctional precorrin-2 dehydrogenase/sirohydrochlorin ferrochelatase [Cohnella endophytica]RKP54228.1 bifunctional precorrin-2 dehydrogenase/sirohydrochlorin ferrochelatase [Cohnella endophytica]